MVNAVMDAIALLSSLASDLDVMLNDLRSAPNHGTSATPTATRTTTTTGATTTATATAMATTTATINQQQQQQQQHSRQLQLQHWQSISNNNNNNNISYNYNNKHSIQMPRPQCLSDIKLRPVKMGKLLATTTTTAATSATTTLSATASTATTTQLQQATAANGFQRRRVASKATPSPPQPQRRPAQRRQRSEQQQLQQQLLQQQRMELDTDATDTDASDLANMTSPLSASAAATRIIGLSPDVKKLQKLPLWCRNNSTSTNNKTIHNNNLSNGSGSGIMPQRRLTTTANRPNQLHNIMHHSMSQELTNQMAAAMEETSKVEVIVYTTKSDKTLKQNINAKDETMRKRTSLIIVPQQVDDIIETSNKTVVTDHSDEPLDKTQQKHIENGNGNRNSIASMDSCVSTNTSQSNQSCEGSSSSSSSSSSSTSSEDAHAAYQDLENGNAHNDELNHHHHHQHNHDHNHHLASVLHSPSCSTTSESTESCCSSVDYSLREQLQNFANRTDEQLPTAAQLLKGMTLPMEQSISGGVGGAATLQQPHCDALLSPQEVPLGRRYAEVAQFKAHGKARTSEQSAGVAGGGVAAGVATPLTEKTESVVSAVCNKINNINNNNNSGGNNNAAQQSQKSQLQQNQNQNQNHQPQSNNNNNNSNKLNGQSNLSTNNNMTPNSQQLDAKTIDSRRSSSLEPEDADDVVDLAHGGAFDDDMQALLPKCTRRSRDELSQSRTSLVSSSEGGILAEGETSSEESSRDSSDNSPPCDLGLMERLLLTHPMWFLPGIQRSGAVHLLQGKEEGTFIVRGSSQPNTMAVSVRLPQDTGPYIEHYLIQSMDNILSLESSRFKFGSIPALIAHYAQCCDELPVQLMLPRVLREANNRKKLSSLALLGQEFWSYASSPAVLGPPIAKTITSVEQQLLDAKSPLSLTETSGLGTATFFSDAGCMVGSKPPAVAPPQPTTLFSPTGSGQLLGFFSQAGTPSDTNSSMSSFSTSGGQHMQLLSPNSVDSVILTMSPVDAQGYLPGGAALEQTQLQPGSNNLSTFKTNSASITELEQVRPQRPKPPNTLNLKPPAPPMRWSKPHSPDQLGNNNFTVTTTVTFSMENNNGNTNGNSNGNNSAKPNPAQFVEVTTPASSNPFNALLNSQASTSTFQTFAKRMSPEGECKDTLSSQGSSSNDSRWQSQSQTHSQSSRDSSHSQRKMLSPMTPNVIGGGALPNITNSSSSHSSKSRKSRIRKESKHYQESDILESPPAQYCASALSDKISDYEDVWSHDPSDRASLLTSFKPGLDHGGGVLNRRPDLLAETPSTPTQQLLSPCEREELETSTGHDTSQQLMQFSGDAQPRSRAGLLLPNLAMAGNAAAMTQSLTEQSAANDDGGDTTPTAAQTPGSRSKQGSPFYAEPADALRQAGLTNAAAGILRRQQRSQLLPANQRHSEPLKGGLTTTTAPLLLPADLEKLAGSLDELKQKPKPSTLALAQPQQPAKRGRNRIEHWQLDSSWEFMPKQDTNGDYDNTATDWQEKENSLSRDKDASGNQKKRPLTVHQIIAKRLPDLNLPELVRCSTPPQTQPAAAASSTAPLLEKANADGSQKSFQNNGQNGCRLSSYDNVERNCAAFCQTYYGGIDSAQSDDGTVFSEPWDSSQWDSFMPMQDDATINSDTIHLSKCRPALSEDDTIIEEFSSTKDGSNSSCNQDTLKANKNGTSAGAGACNSSNNNNSNGNKAMRPKVATILRNPSMRDREILCHPRNKINVQSVGPGDSLRAYTLQLAQDPSSTFARNIENFISCTKESREAAPQVVMRNMRQFMSGMKNYLVKHGEGKFHAELESARARLKSDEFLNLDAMLETVMHQLVVLPLREHLYGIFVDYYKRSEDIQLLAQNVRYACERDATDFGIRATVTPPSQSALRLIANLLWRLQEAELPLDKLELFLCVISTVFDATGCPRGQQLGADDFLPVLVYVVAKCGFVGAEIEAEFMWGLLQPTLLNGEPGYYLTALCSAVQVLKTFMASEGESGSGSLDWRSSCLPACSSVLRVIIPDECNGSLQTRTLPVRPHTTTREVCRIIAHKARITNPQDYALFKLVDGEETLLSDAECPQDARLAAKGKHCMLAYKRIDAKIAWPTTATQASANH